MCSVKFLPSVRAHAGHMICLKKCKTKSLVVVQLAEYENTQPENEDENSLRSLAIGFAAHKTHTCYILFDRKDQEHNLIVDTEGVKFSITWTNLVSCFLRLTSFRPQIFPGVLLAT